MAQKAANEGAVTSLSDGSRMAFRSVLPRALPCIHSLVRLFALTVYNGPWEPGLGGCWETSDLEGGFLIAPC